MNASELRVGMRVKSLVEFSGVPAGSQGVVDEDYGTGFMVAWDLPGHPLPAGYTTYEGVPVIQSGITRDGFDKKTELQYLEAV
jgi:hypothetical protein